MKQIICDECRHASIFVYRSDVSKTSSPLVFLLAEDKVMKFFADKKECEREEMGLARTESCSTFLTPKVLLGGRARVENEKLPYIICSRVPGLSYQELILEKKVCILDDMLSLAHSLGIAVRELHKTKDPKDPPADIAWAKWTKSLQKRKSKLWRKRFVRENLSEQAYKEVVGNAFFPPNMLSLVAWKDEPVFLHGDLNNENVMVELVKGGQKGGYRFSGIVDFGDSHFGHRLYEFVAIHLSVFFCDKDLLSVFLKAYGYEMLPAEAAKFAYSCVVYMLLSDSPALKTAARCCPEIKKCQSLAEIGDILFDLSSQKTGVWGIQKSLVEANKKTEPNRKPKK